MVSQKKNQKVLDSPWSPYGLEITKVQLRIQNQDVYLSRNRDWMPQILTDLSLTPDKTEDLEQQLKKKQELLRELKELAELEVANEKLEI